MGWAQVPYGNKCKVVKFDPTDFRSVSIPSNIQLAEKPFGSAGRLPIWTAWMWWSPLLGKEKKSGC